MSFDGNEVAQEVLDVDHMGIEILGDPLSDFVVMFVFGVFCSPLSLGLVRNAGLAHIFHAVGCHLGNVGLVETRQ